MNKYKKLFLPFLVVALSGLLLFFFSYRRQVNQPITTPAPQSANASLSVNSKTFNIADYVGKSALEATQANLNTGISGSGENAFVTSIDGVAADTKKHEFWELDVNGVPAQVGAGSYTIMNGDQLVWKISTY